MSTKFWVCSVLVCLIAVAIGAVVAVVKRRRLNSIFMDDAVTPAVETKSNSVAHTRSENDR